MQPLNSNQPQPTHVTPHLDHRAEFEAVLANYKPSAEAQKILNATPIVMMSGMSGTGRNTVIYELLKTGHYHFIISDTTRPPRYNDGVLEQNGVEYFFRKEDEMLADLKEGMFIEAEVIHQQQVSGQSIREIERAHHEGKIAINEVEILGSLNMHALKDDTISIILIPPSFDEWMRRFHNRTKVEPDELYRRMQTATHVLKAALENSFFTVVVNDDLQTTIKVIDDLARNGTHNKPDEAAARTLAKQLYQEISDYLRSKTTEYQPF